MTGGQGARDRDEGEGSHAANFASGDRRLPIPFRHLIRRPARGGERTARARQRRGAREQVAELRAAEQRNDAEAAQNARRQIARLAEIVRAASNEGRKCMPAPAPPPKVLLGTVVKVEIDRAIPPVDP